MKVATSNVHHKRKKYLQRVYFCVSTPPLLQVCMFSVVLLVVPAAVRVDAPAVASMCSFLLLLFFVLLRLFAAAAAGVVAVGAFLLLALVFGRVLSSAASVVVIITAVCRRSLAKMPHALQAALNKN